MRMVNASSRPKSHWPQTPMFMVLFLSPFVICVSLGQNSCGSQNNYVCPLGYCCNQDYVCGNTTADCGVNCTSQCAGASGVRCGPKYGGQTCPNGQCCSTFSYCGVGDSWCGVGNCSAQCPNGLCGANGGQCQPGDCCNMDGYCGTSTGYCDAASCASQCPPPQAPSPSPAPSTVMSQTGIKGQNVGMIVGLSAGILVSFALGLCIAVFVWIRSRERPPEDYQLKGIPMRFTYGQLSDATGDFSEESELGQGKFGIVHRGELSGILVAVKKMINGSTVKGEKDFMKELEVISQLQHRNLIQLQGWCKDAARGEALLVCEFMPNGSLDKVLFGPADSETPPLSWLDRFNILIGTANGLNYLHRGSRQQVIHRDVKPENIMLDEDWNAKLGDFGLARLVDQQIVSATSALTGTIGYMAPEALTGEYTEKADVYAFGVVVLAIVCGRRPVLDNSFPEEERFLVNWVRQHQSEGTLLRTVDERLQVSDYEEHMEKVLEVGLWCSHPDPQSRPSMEKVLQVLDSDDS